MYTVTLALVIITTVVFGTFMPVVQRCLFPRTTDFDDAVNDSMINEEAGPGISSKFETDDIKPTKENINLTADVDEHHEMVHPNMEDDPDDEDEEEGEEKKGFNFYFKKFDKEIMRPLLIYNYNPEAIERQEQFVEMIQNDKDAMFKVYDAIRQTENNNH